MALYNRRGFLATTALTVAGVSLGTRRLTAAELASGLAPVTLMPEPMEPGLLESLASRAVEAAKAAGATYADVRVAARQVVGVYEPQPLTFVVDTGLTFGYGVRALVDGVWGFVHGSEPTADSIAKAAQGAVTQARTNAAVASGRTELAPAPVATGEWSVPVKIDPFAVPIHDQMALVGSWGESARRIMGAGGGGGLTWHKETRVVATTEGTRVTQHFLRSRAGNSVLAGRMRGRGPVALSLLGFGSNSGGYETVIGPAVHEQMITLAEEANRLALLPGVSLDVGRYPIVLDGSSFGNLLARTVGCALEMDRVLGEEADASGTSYLSPAPDFLGTPTFSSLLNVTANRALPSITSAKWDDEGVEIKPSTVIQNGTLVDYQTTRSHAPALRDWYQKQGHPIASRGCAVAPDPDTPVYARCNDLTVAPGKERATIDDLIKDMPRGILVREAGYLATDQQLSSGSLTWGQFFEVQRGKVVRRIGGVALQFSTVPFWKSLTALGDATTVLPATGSTMKGMPWYSADYQSNAPAAAFKAVDVIDIGRRV
jgi:TldD protein